MMLEVGKKNLKHHENPHCATCGGTRPRITMWFPLKTRNGRCHLYPQDGIEINKITQPRIIGSFHWLCQSIWSSSQRNSLENFKKVWHSAKIHSTNNFPTTHHCTTFNWWLRSRDWINNWGKRRWCFRPNYFYYLHGFYHKHMETKRGSLTLPLQIKTRLHHHRTT